MQTTREEIEDDVKQTLSTLGTTLNNRLSEGTANYYERLHHSQCGLAAVLFPFRAENPVTSLPNPSKRLELEVSLGDRMEIIRNDLDETGRALDEHWKEWTRTQQNIISLGVEILGPGFVTAISNASHCVFKKKFSKAIAAFDRHNMAEEKVHDTIQKQNGDIRDLTRDVIKQSKAQETVRNMHPQSVFCLDSMLTDIAIRYPVKRWRDDKQKEREEVCQLARKMAASQRVS
jgi:hypothetical protein